MSGLAARHRAVPASGLARRRRRLRFRLRRRRRRRCIVYVRIIFSSYTMRRMSTASIVLQLLTW